MTCRILPRVGLACALTALGCSGDQVERDPEPGGGGAEVEEVERCAGFTDTGRTELAEGDQGLFDSPDEFDRSSCQPGALADLDACGIWHFDLIFDEGYRTPAAVRIDTAGAELEGRLFGMPADDVLLDRDQLLVRGYQQFGDFSFSRTLYACELDERGVLHGEMRSCYDGECSAYAFEGHKTERLDEPTIDGMTLLAELPLDSEYPDRTRNVRHHGDYAYVAGDGLTVVDLSDPANPSEVVRVPDLVDEYREPYNDVRLHQAEGSLYALMASDVRGVVVYDVTEPSSPAEVTTFPAPVLDQTTVNVHTLFLEGERLYITNTSIGGVQVFDISDPAQPALLGQYVHDGQGEVYPHDLFVADGVVYIDYWGAGMVVVDFTSPDQPTVLGIFDSYQRRTSHSNWVTEAGGRTISVHGDEDFDAHVRIVDVDEQSDEYLEAIGSYQTRPEVSVHNIMAVGELALVTYYQDGLRVLDLADPTQPRKIAHFHSWPGPEPQYGNAFYEGAIGVDYDAERELILLADTHRGLFVLELDR